MQQSGYRHEAFAGTELECILGSRNSQTGTGAFVTCRSGYYVWKNWDNWETNFNNGNLNTADKPIFKIEEVLLNEAEAKFELGILIRA